MPVCIDLIMEEFEMKEYERIHTALDCLSPNIKAALLKNAEFIAKNALEIRLRINLPLVITARDKNYFVRADGSLAHSPSDKALIVQKSDLEASFNRICRYSVYSVQSDIINGFVTVSGGHRAGLCGEAVISGGNIINIKNISSINLRISREVKGCAAGLWSGMKNKNGVLICGEPCSGKTTVLRDLARYISIKENKSVSLIDERGELAASVNGENQNDVGLCDVFTSYPKSAAVEQALRTMSPGYIICDEIGSDSDLAAIKSCLNSGVTVIAAMHASSPKELKGKPNGLSLLKSGAFDTVVFLDSQKNAGRVKEIVSAGDLLGD